MQLDPQKIAYIVMARKNGKSALAAALVLYLLVADGEESAEVYGAGTAAPAGRLPTALVARVTDAAPPQRLVFEQPVPVITDGHATAYVSFPHDTARLGPGQFVLRIVRRSAVSSSGLFGAAARSCGRARRPRTKKGGRPDEN